MSNIVSVYDILEQNGSPERLQRKQPHQKLDYRQIGQRMQDDPYMCRRRKYIKTDFQGQIPPPPQGYDWRDYMHSQPQPGQSVWVWNGKEQRIDYLAAGVWWRGGDDVTHWRPILRAGESTKEPDIQLSEAAKNADRKG